MKKLIFPFAIAAAALPAASALADVSQGRDVPAFNKISLDGLLEAVIEVGGDQSVVITANKERYLEDTITRVRGDTLIVDMDMDSNIFSLFKNIEVTVHITVPSLEGVELDGLGDVTIRNLDADRFDLNLDGMGSINIDGVCRSADFRLDGMGDLNARDLECENIRLHVDGMGDADVFASEFADVALDGMGDVDVYGSPARTRFEEDGMGDIEVK